MISPTRPSPAIYLSKLSFGTSTTGLCVFDDEDDKHDSFTKDVDLGSPLPPREHEHELTGGHDNS